LLIGVPISASTGGMGTIIGSPPNAIAAGALENAGIHIDFLNWMIYGMPLALVLTAISCFVLIKMFVKDTTSIPMDFLEDKKSDNSNENRIQRKIVITIIIVTVLLWLTSSVHGLSVAAVSAIPIVFLTLTGVLAGKDVQGLPWDTLFLVAGGLSLGVALQHTGLLNHYVEQLKTLDVSEILFIFILAYVTMLFSNIMSNTATSTVLIPLGMALLINLKTEVALIIGLAASTALFLPVSTPPNAIAYSTGLLEQKDFRVGGILIGLLGPGLVILWVLLIS
jgi:sodium-dependent dicarboxylate transporter 2/3/5